MEKSYYQVLGVSPESTLEEIKQAYRKLAKENHPDLNPGNQEAEERFKEIAEAWETLGDVGKKSEYDLKLKGKASPIKPRPANGKAAPMGQVDINEMMKGFTDIFTENHYQQEVKSKAGKSPMDTSDMFEKFMGFKK